MTPPPCVLGRSSLTSKFYVHLMPSFVAETIRKNLPNFGTVWAVSSFFPASTSFPLGQIRRIHNSSRCDRPSGADLCSSR